MGPRSTSGHGLPPALLASAFDHAPVGLAVFDLDHRYLAINQTLARMYGVPAEDHIGRTITEMRPPEVSASVVALLEQARRTRRPLVQQTAPAPPVAGHAARHILGSFAPIFDGDEVVAVVVTALDVTARVSAETERGVMLAEARAVAATLQGQLLPRRLVAPGWLDVAHLYRPQSDRSTVGGDFFDLVPGAGGPVGLVGDVEGKGEEAGTVAGATRHLVRGLATALPDVAAVAEGVNRALVADPDITRRLSLVLVGLGRDHAGVRARVVCAGHPHPVLVGAGGRPRDVGRTGVLMGVEAVAYEAVEVALAPGDALVLYTDGVTDARARAGRFGLEGLHAALAGPATSAAGLVDRVTEALARFDTGDTEDDTAMLVLRVRPDARDGHGEPARTA